VNLTLKPASNEVVGELHKAWADYIGPAQPGWALGQKLNLASFMGERMGYVLARLEAAEAEVRENRDRLTRHHRYIEGLTGGSCRICAHEGVEP
jgi:hypothetical protein